MNAKSKLYIMAFLRMQPASYKTRIKFFETYQPRAACINSTQSQQNQPTLASLYHKISQHDKNFCMKTLRLHIATFTCAVPLTYARSRLFIYFNYRPSCKKNFTNTPAIMLVLVSRRDYFFAYFYFVINLR